jgi:hypothetical protein
MSSQGNTELAADDVGEGKSSAVLIDEDRV